MKPVSKCVVLNITLALILPSLAVAQNSSGEDEWQFRLAPLFLWGMNIDGNTQIGRAEAPIDIEFDDVLENIQAVFTIHFEARKRDLTLFAEYQYVDLQPSFDTPVGPVAELDQTIQMGELGAAYKIATFGVTDLEVLAGARFTRQDLDIDLDPGPVILSTDESWVDGFAGVRFYTYLNEKWTLSGRCDIGAGGSDFVWNIAAMVDYRFRDWGSAFFGYRWLDYDYESGSQADFYSYNALQQGPLAGLAFYW